jgi:tetratricopeptide (TPR) repeat protein/pimeloyl-ACP methyl ester carboxylesterase
MAQIIHVGSGSGEKHANVIFLHGLGGDLRATWRHGPDDRSFWPRWLAENIPGLAVYSIGYDASVSRWRGTAMHLTDRATNVLARILAEPELQSGQLILIGHSLGGLIIKQLLQNAESEGRHNTDAASFLKRMDKVAFLATPHTGSDLAAFGNRIRILAKPSAATTCLVRNDPNLRRLNSWYRTWANARGIMHLTLTETEAIHILGMVVKPDSGDAGLAGSSPVPVNSNHWTICKPADKTRDTYVFVRKFIERSKTATEEELASLNAKVDKLVVALGERGETANAEKAGVRREVIIQLAQRINADVDDFEQALLELERAVRIAIEVSAEGRRGSNSGDFVDMILERIAEKSADGRFEEAAAEADTAFVQWEREEAERRHAAIAGGLKLLDAGLRQDILRRDPVSAAKRIKRRVALEHPDDQVARFVAMRVHQDEWYKSGRDKGLNFDLLLSIEAARLLLTSASGLDEAGAALNELGVALMTLGARENGTARLQEAVEIYRACLESRTRERAPLDWAKTQNNLGNALQSLGERESGITWLEQSTGAYRAALQVFTRDDVPFEWATVQNNLGAALLRIGERESSIAHLEQAAEACNAALQKLTRDGTPLDWAMAQTNRGNALNALGQRENDPARLEQAVESYRAALQEYTPKSAPLAWAATQNNLGGALWALGWRESGTVRLEQALDAYRAALLERTRERVPLDWAATQNNLGNALLGLGDREGSTERLEQAIDAFHSALQERTHQRVPHLHDQTKRSLAVAVEMLEKRRNRTDT